jgi:hypothetical protein
MRYLLFMLFNFISGIIFCQAHFALEGFTVYQNGDQIVLTWTMKPGNTCLGTGILRSVDGEEFREIGIITGICGSPDKAVSYTFVDSMPFSKGLSYYKLVLGILGESKEVSIRYIDFSKQKVLIFPNPGNTTLHIVFHEDPILDGVIRFYDSLGHKIFSAKITNENSFYFENLNTLHSIGNIYFTVTNQTGQIISSGNFVHSP